jgi:hypothetical protein
MQEAASFASPYPQLRGRFDDRPWTCSADNVFQLAVVRPRNSFFSVYQNYLDIAVVLTPAELGAFATWLATS